MPGAAALPDNPLGAFGLPETYVPAPGASAPPSPALAAPAPANGYVAGIAGHESGGRADAENPYFPVSRGGPLGAHQFIASTWQSFADANPDLFRGMSKEQILAARTDPALSAKATEWYAAQNAPVLVAAGIVPTPANLGIAHALGPAGATGVLRFPDATPLAVAFKESQPDRADVILAQNPTYRTMTVGDLKRKYDGLDRGQYAPAETAVQVAAVAPPAAPLNRLSSLQPGANSAAQSLQQRMAYLQQLQSLFKTARPTQAAGGVPAATMVGGVNESIPLMAGRGYA